MHTKRVVGSCNQRVVTWLLVVDERNAARRDDFKVILPLALFLHCFFHARNSLFPGTRPPSFDQRSRGRCPRIPKEMFSLDRRESGAGRLATSAKIREIFIDRSCTHLASSPRSGATAHVASSHPRCNVTVRENCVGSTLQIIPLTVHPRRPLNSSRASRCLSRIEKTLD